LTSARLPSAEKKWADAQPVGRRRFTKARHRFVPVRWTAMKEEKRQRIAQAVVNRSTVLSEDEHVEDKLAVAMKACGQFVKSRRFYILKALKLPLDGRPTSNADADEEEEEEDPPEEEEEEEEEEEDS